jgi:hypothetical protein
MFCPLGFSCPNLFPAPVLTRFYIILFILSFGIKYSKPSLIRLQLIRIEMSKMKILSTVEYIRTLKDTCDLGARGIRARGLSGCVEGGWGD